MKSINKNLRFRNGSILTYVLIIFLVLFILLTSILYVNSANIKQVIAQEDYLKAYYLAYAGVELGYAALMADDEALYEVFKNNANYQKTDYIQ